MNPPFEVSPEAERHLVERLAQGPPSENEPSLTHARRGSVRNKEGELVERCDHGQYFHGASPPSKHAGFSRVEISGITVAMSPATLESLRGKRLSVQRLARIDDPSRSREILVATDLDEAKSTV
jgi:hypothetical protein